MGGFDRSKLKATALSTVKQQEKDQQTKRPSGGDGFDRSYHKIDNGDNTFRIFPFHPDGGGSSFAEAKCVSFLSVRTQKRDQQGKPVEGEFEVKRRPIFNSKVHGNLEKDLVETYLEVAKKIAIPNFVDGDKEEFDRIWKKIVGMDGIKPQDTWVVYAAKLEAGKWNLGLLELKKTIKNQLTDLAAAFSDNVQSPDPFTDPDEGIAVIINRSGEGLKTEYKVTLQSEKIKDKGRITESYIPTPLTDQQLEEWSKLDPLYKMYVNTFKRSDLEAQIDGLQRFDEELATKHKAAIAVLQYDEILNVIDELSELVPEDDEKEEKQQQKSAPKQQKQQAVQEEVEEEAEEVEVQQPIARPNRLIRKSVEQPPTSSAPAAIPSPVTSASDRLAALKKKLGK